MEISIVDPFGISIFIKVLFRNSDSENVQKVPLLWDKIASCSSCSLWYTFAVETDSNKILSILF